MFTRRSFLRIGAASAALLAGLGIASQYVGRDAADDRRRVLRATIPVVLDGVLPTTGPERAQAVEQTLREVETTIDALAPATRDELHALFVALAAAPSRRLLAGLAMPWEEAHADAVAATLQRWRTHRLSLLQGAYHALHDLILGTAYADEARWAAIGYPGPPAL